MASLIDLPNELDREALTCRAIVETPHGSRAKLRGQEMDVLGMGGPERAVQLIEETAKR